MMTSDGKWMSVTTAQKVRLVGYVRTRPSGEQRITINGVAYGMDELLKAGYTFADIIPATPELLGALRAVVHGFTSYLNPEEYEAELEIVRRAIEGVGNDAPR